MKFCCNISFTLPKQSQRSRSVLLDGFRVLGLFWKEKKTTLSYNRRNTVSYLLLQISLYYLRKLNEFLPCFIVAKCFMTSFCASQKMRFFQNRVCSQRKEFAPRGPNSFLSDWTPLRGEAKIIALLLQNVPSHPELWFNRVKLNLLTL